MSLNAVGHSRHQAAPPTGGLGWTNASRYLRDVVEMIRGRSVSRARVMRLDDASSAGVKDGPL